MQRRPVYHKPRVSDWRPQNKKRERHWLVSALLWVLRAVWWFLQAIWIPFGETEKPAAYQPRDWSKNRKRNNLP